jgi:hypothetical protein
MASANTQGGGFKLDAKQEHGQLYDKVLLSSMNKQFLMAMKWNRVIDLLCLPDLSAMNAWMEDHTDPEHDTIEEWHPFAFASQINASDNPTWEEAMNGPEKASYWKACEKEIDILESKHCWDEIDKENWMNTLP